jgi:hypothetical protein
MSDRLMYDIRNAVVAMRDAANTIDALGQLLDDGGIDIPEHERDIALIQRLENAARRIEGYEGRIDVNG